MQSAVTAVQMAIRVLGVIQIVLGVLFWTGNALGLVDLHILNGIVIVLLLWVMAGLAARAGVERSLVALDLANTLATKAKARLAPVA
jgi:hypothetical protein